MKQIISLFLTFAMLTAPAAGLRNYEDSKNKDSTSIEHSFFNNDLTKDRFSDFFEYNAPLSNTYHKLNNGEELNIVFFGGSVTAGFGSTEPDKYSWRALTSSWFAENFPEAEINTFNAAIGLTGTSLGVYRLSDDVLSKNPDLVFIEFAINDMYAIGDMTYYERSLPEAENVYEHSAIQFETIVRSIKKEFPQCDIVTVLVTDRERSNPDEPYPSADAHRYISKEYGISVVDVGKALVSSLVSLDDTEWNIYFTDIVHPTDVGYKNYFDTLEEFLFNNLFAVDFSKLEEKSVYLPPVQSKVLLDGAPLLTHITEDMLKNSKGFNVYTSSGNKSSMSDYVYTSDHDAEFVFSFSGTDILILTNLSNDSVISYSIDGEKERKALCSMVTHLTSSLAPGEHTLVITPYKLGEKSGGNMIIYAVLTNDSSKRSIAGDK